VILKKIIIPATLQVIGDECFMESIQLERVSLPDNVFKMEEYFLWNCSSLREINCLIKLITLAMEMFEGFQTLSDSSKITYSDSFNDMLKRVSTHN
jgi:hypothetical protein